MEEKLYLCMLVHEAVNARLLVKGSPNMLYMRRLQLFAHFRKQGPLPIA